MQKMRSETNKDTQLCKIAFAKRSQDVFYSL